MDNILKLLEKFFIIPAVIRIIIFAILWIIITIGVYFLLINPQLKTIEQKKFELSKLKKQTLAIVKVKKQLASFQKELRELEKNFKIALKKLPDSKEIPQLLFDITEYGKKHELDFLLFKPGKITKKEFFGSIPIEVKISGKYHDIGQFLYDIANMTRIVKVPKFSLNPQTPNGILQMDGKIETYVFLKENLKKAKKKHGKKKSKKK